MPDETEQQETERLQKTAGRYAGELQELRQALQESQANELQAWRELYAVRRAAVELDERVKQLQGMVERMSRDTS